MSEQFLPEIEAAKIIAHAILQLSKSIDKLAIYIAEDEALNYSIGRGLSKIAEAIGNK
jgi:hypothetical protein